MFDQILLKKRILEISFNHKLSHIGSCLNALPIICEIYDKKKEEDIFILSSGHAGLALYVVLESKYGYDAEKLLEKHGIHPSRDSDHKIFCSTGSLGIGITIGVGAALASPEKDVYVLCSDGESNEGSFWESLRFIEEKKLTNCKVYVNMNGYSAYDEIDLSYLIKRISAFAPKTEARIGNRNWFDYPFLKGLDAHYYVMNEKDFELC